MKQELDDLLCKKYPKIFAQRNWDMSRTCMCWGFTCEDGWFNIIDTLCYLIQSHIDWTEQNAKFVSEQNYIITQLQAGNNEPFYAYLSNLTNFPDEDTRNKYIENRRLSMMQEGPRDVSPCVQVEATQVKQKLGGLRFYIGHNAGDAYIRGAISMAEDMSMKTCEVCGSPGKRRGGGWIRTLCDEHATAQNKQDGNL